MKRFSTMHLLKLKLGEQIWHCVLQIQLRFDVIFKWPHIHFFVKIDDRLHNGKKKEEANKDYNLNM